MSEMNEAAVLKDGDSEEETVFERADPPPAKEWTQEQRLSEFRAAARPTLLHALMVFESILFVATRIYSSNDPQLRGNLFRMETFMLYALALMYTCNGVEFVVKRCIVRDDDYKPYVTGRVLYQIICYFFVAAVILAFAPVKFASAKWIEFSELTGASLSAFIVIAAVVFAPLMANYDKPHFFYLFVRWHWMLAFAVQVFLVGVFVGFVFLGVLVAKAPPYTFALMETPGQILAFTALTLFAQAVSWGCVFLGKLWFR